MSDPMMEEIWRVRAQLLKDHGGPDGYWKYIETFDRAHRRRKRPNRKTGRRATPKAGKHAAAQ